MKSRFAIAAAVVSILSYFDASFAHAQDRERWDDDDQPRWGDDPTRIPVETQRADRAYPYVHSAFGPGLGHGAVALGGRAFIPSSDVIVPIALVDVGYVRTFRRWFDFELHISTLGIGSLLDLGGRFRLVATPEFSLALRLDLSSGLVILGGPAGTLFAATIGWTPGIIASWGSETWQLSFALDTPLVIAGVGASGAGVFAGSNGFTYVFRPSITVELPVSSSTDIFVQAQAYVSKDGDVLPALAAGATW